MIQQFQIVFFSCQKVTLSNFHTILLKKQLEHLNYKTEIS